jgi:uncharacterized protein (TIGR03067 family)
MQWRKEDKALGCPPKDQIVMKFAPNGKVLQLITFPMGRDGLERPGELNWVHCIAEDSQGSLYLGDIMGKRAQKFRHVPPDSLAKKDDAGLHGTWRVVSAEEEGKKHAMAKDRELLYVFDRGKIQLKLQGKVIREGTYESDSSKTPRTLDMVAQDETGLGIYKIDNDVLTICSAAYKANPVRPTEFATKANSGTVLFTLERVKP